MTNGRVLAPLNTVFRRSFLHWRSGAALEEYCGNRDFRGGRSSAEKVALRLFLFAGLSPQVSESKGRKRTPRDAPLETAAFHLKDVSQGNRIAEPFWKARHFDIQREGLTPLKLCIT
ncbi:hypothetical protein CgunFtcFv8_019093 [Champsocephalus gunnari]|uniref:Uncharacterized protein n=1 Tax=Champsocephalus gunnari TaxID=52237 RepID=A0AAN8HRT0_CHAGU|nr:hypothetical protein CgunFtcFv8_019093 [Champsocephalus gunnari]